MKTPLRLGSAALLLAGSLTGCYTQLYTRGYAERAAYPYPDAYPDNRAAASGDSALPDSLAASDSARRPNTVIVNNYYRESPYYRGYPIDAWDHPYFSFGFYSGRYRDYYGPYWWNDPYPYRRGWYHRHHDGRPGGPSGGGSVGEAGPYRSDKRIFQPEPSHPPVRKGKRSEPAPSAAPKESGGSSNTEPSRSDSGGGSSSGSSSSVPSSSSSSGSSRDSGNEHPRLEKGRRR